jgi:hypothetical protein
LFHSSAITGIVIEMVSANKPPTYKAFDLLFIYFLLHLSMGAAVFSATRFDLGRWISESAPLISVGLVSSIV